ncbi:MAG: hypothetical protein ACFCGT_03655 [Sandaracinaceae bacterium]
MTDAFLDGLALAAVALGDRDGSLAAPGLANALRGALEARLAALTALDRPGREVRLRAWSQGLLPPVRTEPEPAPRVARLIAHVAPSGLGRRWRRAGAGARPGYRPPPGLLRTLRILHAAPGSADG